MGPKCHQIHNLCLQTKNFSEYANSLESGLQHEVAEGGENLSVGKKHAFKKYDQFALNTSCFWGEVPDQILPQLCNFTKFLSQK